MNTREVFVLVAFHGDGVTRCILSHKNLFNVFGDLFGMVDLFGNWS